MHAVLKWCMQYTRTNVHVVSAAHTHTRARARPHTPLCAKEGKEHMHPHFAWCVY